MHELLSSWAGANDLLFVLGIINYRRREELTKSKGALQKGTFYKRIRVIDSRGFADQDKITYGLGYNLFQKRDTDDIVILRDNGVVVAKVVLNNISWFVEKSTPNLDT